MVVTPIHSFQPSRIPSFDETLFQASAMVDYTLYDGGARGARISGSAAHARAARWDVRSAHQELIAQVSESYLAVLLARDQLEAHDREIAALESELTRVRDLSVRRQGRARGGSSGRGRACRRPCGPGADGARSG